MAALRVLVADDHEIVRKGVCALITSHPGWEVCGEASDGREAVRKVAQLKPDIVILDIGMPSLNGLEATRQILHQNPRQRILILSITDSQQIIQEVLAHCRGGTTARPALLQLPGRTDGAGGFPEREAPNAQQQTCDAEPDLARTRNRTAPGGGKKYERDRDYPWSKREDG